MAKGVKIIFPTSNNRTIDDVNSWKREATNQYLRRQAASKPYDHWFNPDGSPKTPDEIVQSKRKDQE